MYNQLIVYLYSVQLGIEDDYYNNPGTTRTSKIFQAEEEYVEELINFVLEVKEKDKSKIKLDEEKAFKDMGEDLKITYGDTFV